MATDTKRLGRGWAVLRQRPPGIVLDLARRAGLGYRLMAVDAQTGALRGVAYSSYLPRADEYRSLIQRIYPDGQGQDTVWLDDGAPQTLRRLPGVACYYPTTPQSHGAVERWHQRLEALEANPLTDLVTAIGDLMAHEQGMDQGRDEGTMLAVLELCEDGFRVLDVGPFEVVMRRRERDR